MEFIDLKTQYLVCREAIQARMQTVLDHGRFIMGPEVQELEGVLARYVGARHCLTVASGTDSLEIALRALGIGPGDEVITVPFTWISTAEVVALVGRPAGGLSTLRPIPTTSTLTSSSRPSPPRTKAILPVSLFGQMPDYDRINALGARHGIPVIEDAAQSFGATRNGRRSCAVTPVSSTSFFPAKPLGCYGDGGALFTDSDQMADTMRAIRNHGGLQRHHHTLVGMNGRFDTLQAAVLLAKFPAFPGEVEARARIGARYTELLGSCCGTPKVMPGNTHVYAQYTLRLPNRDAVAARLNEQGIPTAVYYPKCLHEQPVFAGLGCQTGDFPVSEQGRPPGAKLADAPVFGPGNPGPHRGRRAPGRGSPSPMRILCLLAAGFALASAAAAPAAPAFPAPRNTGDPASLGQNIQRTLTLLATSTPARRHTVRILFYGQSITEQDWSRTVAATLRRRFPDANLVVENRAIGGHSSQLLVKTAEADLYPFYPDLLVFYVYGSHIEYENIIRRVRERTTAEILIQTDHATRDEDLTEETDPAKLSPKQWNAWMNYSFLPATIQAHGCGFVDQRRLWKQYLKDFNLPAARLLKDGVHLNDHGNYLMAELVQAQFAHRPGDGPRPDELGRNQDPPSGRGIWRGKTAGSALSLRAIASTPSAAPGPPRRRGFASTAGAPSEIPELRGVTRVQAFPGSSWPCLLRVSSQAPLLAEDWTLTLTRVGDGLKECAFTVSGSKTGPDGEGTSTARFVSKSGRVVLEPDDWNLAYCNKVFKRTVPAGHPIHWKTADHFADAFVSPGIKDPAVETTVTLAQGLKNGRHTLEIEGSPQTPLAALRVYRPPEQEKR